MHRPVLNTSVKSSSTHRIKAMCDSSQPKHPVRPTPRLFQMQNFFGTLGGLGGAVANIQMDLRTPDGRPVAYATVKGRGADVEKHPLFTSHDTVMGDVRLCL